MYPDIIDLLATIVSFSRKGSSCGVIRAVGRHEVVEKKGDFD